MSDDVVGFEVPDGTDDKVLYRAQNGTLFSVVVKHDDCPENPMEDWDGNGKIHSFSSRHDNSLKLNACTQEEAREELNEMFGPEGEGWLQLGYYEHGQCSWFPIEGPITPGIEFQWDGVRFAGVWEVDDDVKANVVGLEGEELRKHLLEYCEGVCKTYTDWCNGSVYGYMLEFTKPDGEEDHDSCWGFYGHAWEYMVSEIEAVLQHHGIESVREVEEGDVFPIIREALA